MSAMQTFSSIGEVAAELRDKTVGTQCGLTGGGARKDAVQHAFHHYGLRVSLTGSPGQWVVTLRQPYDRHLEADRKRLIKTYLGPPRGGSSPVPADVIPKGGPAPVLAVDETVICAGMGGTISNKIRRANGAWTTTIHPINPEHTLWKVTRVSDEPNRALVESLHSTPRKTPVPATKKAP